MRTLRQCVPCLALGLLISFAGAAFAQKANQPGGDKKASCCCMSGGCCGDSCQMTKHDVKKNHATSSDKEGCCCCCGDSCQKTKHDGMKNHATSSDKEGCCCGGDSCDMKEGAARTNNTAATTSSEKHECCCCGDSCNMKDTKNKSGQ